MFPGALYLGWGTHNITSNSRSLTPPPCCLDDEEEHIREARQQQLCYFFQGLLRLHLIILPSLSLCPMCMEIFLPPSDAHMHARSLFRDDASPKYIYVKQSDVFFKGVKNYKFEPRSLQHSPGNNSTCSEPKSRRSLPLDGWRRGSVSGTRKLAVIETRRLCRCVPCGDARERRKSN